MNDGDIRRHTWFRHTGMWQETWPVSCALWSSVSWELWEQIVLRVGITEDDRSQSQIISITSFLSHRVHIMISIIIMMGWMQFTIIVIFLWHFHKKYINSRCIKFMQIQKDIKSQLSHIFKICWMMKWNRKEISEGA